MQTVNEPSTNYKIVEKRKTVESYKFDTFLTMLIRGNYRVISAFKEDQTYILMLSDNRIVGYKTAHGWLVLADFAHHLREERIKERMSRPEFSQFLKFLF